MTSELSSSLGVGAVVFSSLANNCPVQPHRILQRGLDEGLGKGPGDPGGKQGFHRPGGSYMSLSPLLHHPHVCRKLALWPHLQDGAKSRGQRGGHRAGPWPVLGFGPQATPSCSPLPLRPLSSQGASNMSGPPGPHPCHCTRCFFSNAHASVELEPQQGDHFF